MSAQDIRLSVHFPDHPKTIKLDRRLGFQGVRSLLSLWAWAAQTRPDGNLGGANGRKRPSDVPWTRKTSRSSPVAELPDYLGGRLADHLREKGGVVVPFA